MYVKIGIDWRTKYMEKANRVSGGRARPLPRIGAVLKAFHRGRRRSAVIVEAAEFTSGRGVLTGGRAYLSLSAAGTALTGYPVNGWLFWHPIDNPTPASEHDTIS